MRGTVAIVGRKPSVQRLFDGLKRLEYCGYDSAGICTVQAGDFELCRAGGQLENRMREFDAAPLRCNVGTPHGERGLPQQVTACRTVALSRAATTSSPA